MSSFGSACMSLSAYRPMQVQLLSMQSMTRWYNSLSSLYATGVFVQASNLLILAPSFSSILVLAIQVIESSIFPCPNTNHLSTAHSIGLFGTFCRVPLNMIQIERIKATSMVTKGLDQISGYPRIDIQIARPTGPMSFAGGTRKRLNATQLNQSNIENRFMIHRVRVNGRKVGLCIPCKSILLHHAFFGLEMSL